MSKRLGVIACAIMLLFSANALAARRVAVLMLPQDPKSHVSASKFVEYLEDAVDQHRDCVLRRSEDTLGDSTPIAAISARKKIRSAVSQAKRQINAGDIDMAEENLRAALNEFSAATAALDRCGEVCDALIHLAGVEFLKGEENAARAAISDVLAMDSSFKFDGAAFDKSFMLIYREMQDRMTRQGRLGTLVVQSSPPGARVFIDGEERGFSPLTLDHLPVGKHLLRVERAGYLTYGQIVEVSEAGSATARPRLTPTEEFSEIADNIEGLSRDIDRKRGSRALSRVGAKLQVERALLGTIRTEGGRVRLNLILADFTEQAILSSASRTFQEDEYGEIGKEVQRLGTRVINAANYASHNNEIKADSSDPLDHRTGMEDWGEEDRGRDQGFDSYSAPPERRDRDDRDRDHKSDKKKKKKKSQSKKRSSDDDRYDDRRERSSSPSRSSSSSDDFRDDAPPPPPRANSMGDEPVESW